MSFNKLKTLFFIITLISGVTSRIHKLTLTDDYRHYVDLTTFGFYKGGILDVNMVNFKLPTGPVSGEYGFTLDRTVNDAISPYLEAHTDSCFLKQSEATIISPRHPAIVFLKMDFVNLKLIIICKGEVDAMHLYQNRTMIPMERNKRNSQYMIPHRRKRDVGAVGLDSDGTSACSRTLLPISRVTTDGYDYYNTSFAMYVASDKEEGLYNLYFHNCPNSSTNNGNVAPMNMVIEIFESNGYGEVNYLSAGEMPLPALYCLMSVIFLFCAAFWTFILKTSRHPVYRIHILMCVLAYLKALSLAFHGINFYFIQIRGEHVTAWAILYYITHLLKGAVLFVTIVLVGTGWNFIKHILADKDKKLFMIVIPLQVVANVAEIIIAESEEGAAEHNAWRGVFILVDLLCCGAILFPVVWSIRHLQDASTTDGKAAINLRKLKLFRHFYIMVVCYIYFTRIIVYLLKISVVFQYSWIDEMFRELATFVFFVMTGYKFRPAAANPYFTPDLDEDEAEILSEIGILDGVTKVPRRGERRREDMEPLMQETNCSDE